MKLSKRLSQLMQSDAKVKSLPKLEVLAIRNDEEHLLRRLQQRAISWDMIKLTLAYGKHEYFNRSQTWTLLDKNLKSTPYQELMDRLRGLRVIADINSPENTLKLTTVYWAYDLRN